MCRFLASLVAFLLAFGAVHGRALADDSSRAVPSARAHGPKAPDAQFPSHVFQLEAHQPQRVELAFHYGMLQPLMLHGFNAAVDVRYKRLVLTYSHGAGLDPTSFLGSTEKAAGMTLREPYSTGGGVGVLLIDELWLLADFKVHHFEAETATERQTYTNVSIGGELGWRFFVWKGFNIALVARYWPNIYSTAGSGLTLHDASGRPFVHAPLQQGYDGLFANVLVGWAFDL
jgi:hypothetical protein